MLIKKLILSDFRQFKGIQEISFSQSKEKNVTIIIGENGTGKTTFEQAFLWCLYGDTSFSDKNLICKSTAQEMKPNDEKIVSVVLEFLHNNTEYKCRTEQTYYKDSTGTLKSKTNRKISLEYKGKDGQQEFVKETQIEGKINEILPKELSNYFFFDGERIGNMSKDIAKGKSKEFPNAVKNLLGLSAFESALNHLNGSHNQNSVVKLYAKSFNTAGNNELKKLISEIDNLEKELSEQELRKEEIEDKDLPTIQKKINNLKDEQMKFSKIEGWVKERSIYEEDLEGNQNLKQTNVSDFFKLFSNRSYNFFALKMINSSINSLNEADIKDSGIPDIHKRTIDFLINRGQCICGSKIESNSEIYNHLIEQLKYIPPQSLGTSIRQFVNIANEKAKNADFYNEFESSYTRIRNAEDKIDECKEELERINKQLVGIDENNIGKLQNDLNYYSQRKEEYIRECGQSEDAIKRIKNEINGKEQSRDRFINIDDTNKKIRVYLAYAKFIYDELLKQYKEEEMKVRKQFAQIIDEIFKNIYNGGLSLEIDENYNIKIIVNDFKGYDEGVETSTAQSLSVILAFISAVIKMARENENGGNKLLVTESYSLVMDAPLSAFDKTRIKTICEVLPNIAEQLIIFINDKDGEIAEIYMKEKIGKKYVFYKENEFETYMEDSDVCERF